MVRLRRDGLCLAAICAALLFAACGSDSSASRDGERAHSEDPSDTTASSEWSPDQQAALDAYEGYLEVTDEAFTAPLDAVAPELDRYATPEAAQDIRMRVAAYQQLGRAVRPETFFEPDTVTVDGSQATIVGCLSDFGVVYEVATETVLDDDRVQHVATTTLVLGDDGGWRVSGTDDGRPGVSCTS